MTRWALAACLLWGCQGELVAAGSGGEPETAGQQTGAKPQDGSSPADASGTSGGGSAGSGGSGGSGGAAPNSQTFVPMFPGAGTSDAAEPLQNGMLCDSVGQAPSTTSTGDVTRCFFGPQDRTNPAATVEQVLECVEGTNVLHLRLTFDPGFVDNTYGDGSIGWPAKRGHTMKDLKGSDHAEIKLVDGDGQVSLQFKVDYISEDDSAPSGFATQGVDGGDGEIISGERDHVVDVSTSLHRNLNERGYEDYTEHSPLTDASYAPNPETPEWDYRMVYEVWIDLEAFGDAGFAGAFIDFVHASPSKGEDSTIEVTPDACPPPQQMDCDDPEGCQPCVPEGPDDNSCGDGGEIPDPEDPCLDGNPDTDCGSGEVPPGPPPAFCELYPTDPACHVE